MPEEKLQGLGGWLILPIIGLSLSVLILITNIIAVNIMPEFNSQNIILSFLYGALLVFVIISLFSIFKKKKYVPKMMIFFYVTIFAISLFIDFLTNNFSIPGLIGSIIGGTIWILYFIKSKRVKNTFVN